MSYDKSSLISAVIFRRTDHEGDDWIPVYIEYTCRRLTFINTARICGFWYVINAYVAHNHDSKIKKKPQWRLKVRDAFPVRLLACVRPLGLLGHRQSTVKQCKKINTPPVYIHVCLCHEEMDKVAVCALLS